MDHTKIEDEYHSNQNLSTNNTSHHMMSQESSSYHNHQHHHSHNHNHSHSIAVSTQQPPPSLVFQHKKLTLSVESTTTCSPHLKLNVNPTEALVASSGGMDLQRADWYHHHYSHHHGPITAATDGYNEHCRNERTSSASFFELPAVSHPYCYR
ncbi:hypothetical protein ACFFRR_007990 [Megaselia abdita]